MGEGMLNAAQHLHQLIFPGQRCASPRKNMPAGDNEPASCLQQSLAISHQHKVKALALKSE